MEEIKLTNGMVLDPNKRYDFLIWNDILNEMDDDNWVISVKMHHCDCYEEIISKIETRKEAFNYFKENIFDKLTVHGTFYKEITKLYETSFKYFNNDRPYRGYYKYMKISKILGLIDEYNDALNTLEDRTELTCIIHAKLDEINGFYPEREKEFIKNYLKNLKEGTIN